MKAPYSLICNICARAWLKPGNNLDLLDLSKKPNGQDSLSGNFCGNAMYCNTAVQEAQRGYYYEESLQEKPPVATEHRQTPGSLQEETAGLRVLLKAPASTPPPLSCPLFFLTTSSSTQTKNNDLSMNLYECCPIRNFSI